MDSSDSSDALIEKKILYKGTQFIPLTDGTKVNTIRRKNSTFYLFYLFLSHYLPIVHPTG